MKFSASKFRKDKRYRRLLPDSHLDILDGREVVDESIDYKVDGEEFYLYPVIPEWCDKEEPPTCLYCFEKIDMENDDYSVDPDSNFLICEECAKEERDGD